MKKMIRTLIIDDQEICCEVLNDLLEKNCKQVEVIGMSNSGVEGIKAIKKHQPDLVLCDVEMPDMSGFEMIKKIGDIDFDLVFVTSYDKYAIDAIRHSAIDFLMKPVLLNELEATIERVENKKRSVTKKQINELVKNAGSAVLNSSKIALPLAEGLIFVNPKEIISCESDSNYTTVKMLSGEKLLITKTLKHIEALLMGHNFFRVHHSHIINLDHIQKYVRGAGGYVVMSDRSTVTVSRERKPHFIAQFGLA